ncbi:PEP-CTERM sorting domain-containing protein [Chamaesiphon sp. GL140_3_metabinner_50]|uniref:PEP-CTERM sorting domain-containing protein n=1 Tax=Chamaesiphon sp. GL140_3_metabinner_50 TaxID=2970812 RepID=UPI0025E41D7C|nr:PEP-CTERM sorting domain-containing protein [Chamaesiphon sp. GL140_3_metabinner_50]
MKRFLIISGLVLSATLVPIKAIAATFSQLVVYGDSLSDLGRAAAATGGAVPPYSALFGDGRFSNGQVWVEYLAASLGIPADGNPATNRATNFAVGGATTGTTNIIQPLIPVPIPALNGIQQQITNDNAIHNPDALYVIWGGANDYLFAGITDPTIPVGNLFTEINTLIGRGARNILVPNLSNLGALPSTRNLGATATGLSNLTAAHNAGLATTIANLNRTRPDVNLNLLDVNSLFNRIVANPSSFGFTDVTTQCIISTTVCASPNANLFWDDVHPTTEGHRLIGELAFNTVSPTAVPEPITMLGSLMAGSAAIAFKRKLKAANVDK